MAEMEPTFVKDPSGIGPDIEGPMQEKKPQKIMMDPQDLERVITDPSTVNMALYILQQNEPMYKSYYGDEPITGKEMIEEMGKAVCEEYNIDLGSRGEWEKNLAQQIKMFTCHTDEKNTPFDGASNVNLPFISMASLQFHAEAKDIVIPPENIAKMYYVGDEDRPRAERSEKYINFQLKYKMREFRRGMDRSILQLPVVGSVFRKHYWDGHLNRVVSDFVSARDVVVSYHAKDLESARRCTHVLYLTESDIRRRMKGRVFLPVDNVAMPGTMTNTSMVKEMGDEASGVMEPHDPSPNQPRMILEQHRYWDINGDGIDDPVVITVDLETQKVLRVTSRRMKDSFGNDAEIQYFTHYYFIPNPEGFYGLGLGSLLRGLNESANTLINEIIDAGRLANTIGGFYSTRSGIMRGELDFKMGTWKPVDAFVEDLRRAIYTFEFQGPSPTLYNTVQMLFDYSQKLSSVTEGKLGGLPSSDTPNTATMAMIEQNRKLFNSIHTRIHDTFKDELEKLYRLWSIYLDVEEYAKVLGDIEVQKVQGGMQALQQDFAPGLDIIPVSDPNIISRAEKIQKAQMIYQDALSSPDMQQNPNIVAFARKMYYKAMEINDTDIEQLVVPPPPPPDLPAEEENHIFMMDGMTEALEQQDHQAHINSHKGFLATEPFATEISPESRKNMEHHIRHHLALAYLMGTKNQQQQMQGMQQRQQALQGQAQISQRI